MISQWMGKWTGKGGRIIPSQLARIYFYKEGLTFTNSAIVLKLGDLLFLALEVPTVFKQRYHWVRYSFVETNLCRSE